MNTGNRIATICQTPLACLGHQNILELYPYSKVMMILLSGLDLSTTLLLAFEVCNKTWWLDWFIVIEDNLMGCKTYICLWVNIYIHYGLKKRDAKPKQPRRRFVNAIIVCNSRFLFHSKIIGLLCLYKNIFPQNTLLVINNLRIMGKYPSVLGLL